MPVRPSRTERTRAAGAFGGEIETGFAVFDTVERSDLMQHPVQGTSSPGIDSERTMQITRRDGQIRWVRYSTTMVELERQLATLLTAVDITPQFEAEDQLRKAEERFELAQRAARWVTWEWFPETDKLEVSSFADSLFGMRVSDDVATGQDFLSVVHPDDRDRMRLAVERLLTADDPLALEIRCLAPDGKIRWLAENGIAVRNGNGRVSRVIGVTHDVTEKKITENALFQERDRAFVTLSSIADGVIRTDSRGNIDYLNPVAQRLTGWSLSESYGQPASEIYQIVDEATGKKVDGLLAKMGKHKTGASCVYVNKLADIDLDVLEEIIGICWETMNAKYPN